MFKSNFCKNLLRNNQILTWFVLPSVFATTSLIYRQQNTPYWLGSKFDPEYAYLLNFLNIIQFKTPGHTDHPGTTLQVLGGIIIQVTYFIQSLIHSVPSDIFITVLQNPEFYLSTVNTTILILTTGCLILLGAVAFKLSQSIVLSLLLQSNVFLGTILNESTRVRPEALLICLTQLLIILLLFFLYSEKLNLPRFSLVLGAVLGLGVATKVTFVPLTLVILLLPGWKQKGLATLCLIVTFFLATFPILQKYSNFFDWLIHIATNTESNGSGNQILFNVSELLSTILSLVGQNRLFFSIIGFSVLNFLILTSWFVWDCLKNLKFNNLLQVLNTNKLYKTFACISLVIVVQLLMTLKHPSIHYLLPSMGLCSMLILVQASLLANLLTPILKPTILRFIGLFVLCIYTILIVTNAHSLISQSVNIKQSYMVEIKTINRLIEQNYINCVHISYYRSSNKEYALKFGDDYASNQFSGLLQTIYPKEVFYNIFNHKYYSFNTELDPNILMDNQCTIFQGNPFKQQNIKNKPNINIKPIFEGHYESLYLVIQNQS